MLCYSLLSALTALQLTLVTGASLVSFPLQTDYRLLTNRGYLHYLTKSFARAAEVRHRTWR